MNLNEIRQNLNLFRQLVSQQTKLNSRDFGLCPFHEEKSPSFHIYNGLDRARFHCFGCGATGDIFNYLFFTEKLNFEFALLKLKSILKIGADESNGLSFLPEYPEWPKDHDSKSCFLNCKNYLNLKEDYEILLAENQELRTLLNLKEFHPSNEIKKNGLRTFGYFILKF